MAMTPRRPFPDLRGLLLCGTALVAAGPAVAQVPNARPQGGVVSAGSATIAQDAARTQVNQTTDRAVIDWRGFDVGRDHAVRFQQPNSGSMTLNRVNAADPSRIAGQVTANGGIAIVNQSGVIFAPGARVEAQSVIVSTADIANQRFMAGGRMVFDRPGRADARIVNEGSITAREAGIAALVAPQVANRGVITARLGTVAIAGAETHVIDLHGDGLMSIEITGPVRQRPGDGGALVANDGTLQADGGRVSLTAAAADGIVQNLVRAGGRVSANTDAATGRRGEVVVAGTGGAVIIEGQVEARGLAAGQRGGTVEVVADRVLAASGARIDVSGTAGGGEIAFGQTRQSAAVPRRAERSGVAAGAVLRADATVLGQGGRVVLHSTDTTLMAGTLSARGGPQGGDGGFVEVSGERGFRVLGAIDVSAPAGRDGTVLFDPENLRISNDPGGDTVVGTGDVADGILTFAEVPGNAVLATGEIADITGHLILQATNSIIVEDAIIKDGGLTLQTGSGGFIAINASITLQSGDLVLIAGSGGITQAAGAISLSSGQLLVQSGGNVSLTAAGNTIPSLGPSSVTGNFTITASGCCSAPVVTLNGAITVSGTFDITAPGASIIQSDGSVITASRLNATATGGSSISLTGANQVTTLGDLTADGSIFFANATTLTVAGTLAINDPQFGQITVRVSGGDLIVNGNVTLPGDFGNFTLSATGNVVIGAGAVLTGGQESFGEGSSFNSIIAGYDPETGFANPALPGGITLAGTIASDGLLYLGAGSGGVVQTGGAVTATSLAFDTTGALRLASASNAIGSLVNVDLEEGSLGTAASGDVVINNGASDLLVDSVLSGANVAIITTGTLTVAGAPPPTVGGTAGLISAPNGRVSLLVGDLSLPVSAFGGGPRILGAVVEIAPATQRQVLLPFPNLSEIVLPPELFVLFDSELALIAASNTLRIGATTFDGVTTATATSVNVIRPFSFAGTLALHSLGDVSQGGSADLTVGALSGAAGGTVTLTNAGNSIGFLDDFSAGGGFALTAGTITLRGLLSAPGQTVMLTAGNGIQSIGTGRIAAGELRATTQAGSVSLTGANQLERLGESSTPGDFTLVNAGPQMTIPAGQTVQAAGTGSVTATAGSITVDGTIRAAALTLSAPAGTVTVNGFSAIAFAGGLALSAQNVTIAGLIAGSTGIDVTATEAASLAGIAQAPTLTITAPSINFGGLEASGSDVALLLGAGGTATGSLFAGGLSVSDGQSVTLTGSIDGITGGRAAARGQRFADGTLLGDPPPDRFDYLFNGCPLAASVCVPPGFDTPVFTVADNPRGVMGELDPAGQPPANPLVQIPTLPFITQPGRDTSEDRELAPPNIRAEDF